MELLTEHSWPFQFILFLKPATLLPAIQGLLDRLWNIEVLRQTAKDVNFSQNFCNGASRHTKNSISEVVQKQESVTLCLTDCDRSFLHKENNIFCLSFLFSLFPFPSSFLLLRRFLFVFFPFPSTFLLGRFLFFFFCFTDFCFINTNWSFWPSPAFGILPFPQSSKTTLYNCVQP